MPFKTKCSNERRGANRMTEARCMRGVWCSFLTLSCVSFYRLLAKPTFSVLCSQLGSWDSCTKIVSSLHLVHTYNRIIFGIDMAHHLASLFPRWMDVGWWSASPQQQLTFAPWTSSSMESLRPNRRTDYSVLIRGAMFFQADLMADTWSSLEHDEVVHRLWSCSTIKGYQHRGHVDPVFFRHGALFPWAGRTSNACLIPPTEAQK